MARLTLVVLSIMLILQDLDCVSGNLPAVCYNRKGGLNLSKPHYVKTQSSTADGAGPDRAVDGQHGLATKTEIEDSPYWKVNLTMPTFVRKIVVWNRIDCCKDELTHFSVKLFNDNSELLKEVSVGSQTSKSYKWSTINTDNVQVIEVIKKNRGVLSMAEVEVYGVPAPTNSSCANKVDPIPNGCHQYLLNSSGDFVQYSCSQGYRLSRDQLYRDCSQTFTKAPICRRKTCPVPSAPENGMKTGSDYRYGEVVSFRCEYGYQLEGPDRVTCSSQGSWSPSASVSCKPDTCSPVTHVENGKVLLREISGSGFVYGNWVEVRCNTGYTVKGNMIVACDAGGVWESEIPTCKRQTDPCDDYFCPTDQVCRVDHQGKAVCVCKPHNCRGSDAGPVCGTDGKTYGSECDLKLTSCQRPNELIQLFHSGKCHPIRHHVCNMPKDGGICKSFSRRFYFNNETNTCQLFVWGGCRKNANNFHSESDCISSCSDFAQCDYSGLKDGHNLAFLRSTEPDSALARTLVDGDRYPSGLQYSGPTTENWTVFLRGLSFVKRIAIWSGTNTLSRLRVVLYDSYKQLLKSKEFSKMGLCLYVWKDVNVRGAASVVVETNDLRLLDEVEVVGDLIVTAKKINWTDTNATAIQGPRLYKASTKAENAIDGIFPTNTGTEKGWHSCALTGGSGLQWLEIDMKKLYFVTKVQLFLREGGSDRFRLKWQSGLRVHSQEKSFIPGSVSNDIDRCGLSYDKAMGEKPSFNCSRSNPSQYVLLTLTPTTRYGLQVCEAEVFATYCGEPPSIANGQADGGDLFAPASASYTCDNGYQLSPSKNARVFCGETGVWEGTPPRCV